MLLSSVVLLISLTLLYFVGRTYRILNKVSFFKNRSLHFESTTDTSVCLLSGLLIQYLCFLVFRSYFVVTIVMVIVALAGWQFFKSTPKTRFSYSSFFKVVSSNGSVLLLIGFLFFLTVMSPIHSWDARSSWFFQGHAMALSGGLFPQPYWYENLYWFPQWEYPKFFSGLVGHISYLFSYWDNYFPKLTLGLIFVPIFILLSTQWRERWSAFWLVSSIIATCHKSLWDGYMDAYVAIYAATSLIFWIRWLEEKKPNNFYLSFISICVLPFLKNEGFILWVMLIVVYSIEWGRTRKTDRKADITFVLPWVILPLCAFGLWHFLKSTFNLQSWLLAKGTVSERFIQHWGEGWALKILERLTLDSFVIRTWTIVFVSVLIALWKKRFKFIHLLPTLITLPYLFVLWLALMITPLDVDYNLSTTQHRIVFALRLAACASVFLITESLLYKRSKELLS